MKQHSIFISFIGSRGSGKTTVANLLAKDLKCLGYRTQRQHRGLARGRSIKSIYNAIALWRYFDWEVMKKIGFCGRSRRLLPSLYQIYLPLAFAKDVSKLKRNSDILIYDSNFLRGMIQALLHEEIKINDITDFYQRKILSELNHMLIVVIDTNPLIAVQRWIDRDEVHVSQSDINKEIKVRIDFQKAVDVVVNALADLPKVQVINLNGDNSPEIIAEELLYYFNKF